MEENQDKERRVKESEKSSNWFDKLIFKMMDFLGFTSGSGIVGIGGFWFITQHYNIYLQLQKM